MPKNTKSNEAAAANSQSADNTAGATKAATHDSALEALHDASQRAEAKQVTSVQMLESSHEALAAAGSNAANQSSATDPQQADRLQGALSEFANQQREHLEMRDSLVNQILADAFSSVSQLQQNQQQEREQCPANRFDVLQERHDAQWAAMQSVMSQMNDGLSALRAGDDDRLRAERVDAQRCLQDPTRLTAQLDMANDRAESLRDALKRDASALDSHLSRETSAAERKMGGHELTNWRDTLNDQRLSDDAIQRVREIASSFVRPESEAAHGAIKGQLMEEIGISRDLIDRISQSENERLRGAGINAAVEFISGDRIRDEHNQKVTDGFFAWRDQEDRLNVVHCLEAKAGEASARSLEAKRTNPSEEFLRGETLEQAQDIVRDRFAGQSVSPDTLKQAVQEEFEQLRRSQTELGQLTSTLERLASGNDRVFVDGRSVELANEEQRRMNMTGLVPEDSRYAHRSEEQVAEDRQRRQEYLAVDITAAQLNEMARLVQELLVQEEIKRTLEKARAQKEAREAAQRAEELEDEDT